MSGRKSVTPKRHDREQLPQPRALTAVLHRGFGVATGRGPGGRVRSTRGVSVAGVRIRHVRPSDADQWLALRAALWPEEGTASLTNAVQRFFTESHSTPGL